MKSEDKNWNDEDDENKFIAFVATIELIKNLGYNDMQLIRRVMFAYRCGLYEDAMDLRHPKLAEYANRWWN